MFPNATKTLLKNYIRHTDTHNRLLEEAEMWRTYNERKERTQQSKRKAHMDDIEMERSSSTSQSSSNGKKDTYWMRRLQEAEEQDPDRWGHAGYKEMYPEHFNSSLSESSDGSFDTELRKKKKLKRKKVKKEKQKEKKRKKKKHKYDDRKETETNDARYHKQCKGANAQNDNCLTSSNRKRTHVQPDSYSSDESARNSDVCVSGKKSKRSPERNNTQINSERKSQKKRAKHKKHKSSDKCDIINSDVVWVEKS